MVSEEPFWNDYRARVRQLLRPLVDLDGCPEEELVAIEVRLGCALPRLLRTFYRLTGKRDDINRSLHRLLPLDDLYLDRGVLVFYEENQNVRLWGVRCRTAQNTLLDDPPVVGAEAGAENIEPTTWSIEFDHLSQFLRAMLFLQASGGDGMEYSGVGQASRENITRGSVGWEHIILGGSWNNEVLLSEGSIVYFYDNENKAASQLFAGAKTEETFLGLEQNFDISWDYCTLDDE